MLTKEDKKRYLFVFIITLTIFLTIWLLSSFISNQKIRNIKSIQDSIAIDILASETQFQLLQELSCKDVAINTLSDALNELATKITYSEENIKNKSEVRELKRYYSLLQIKDYLLIQKIKEKCKISFVPIFYFYTTAENCIECTKQSLVLTKLRKEHENIRVYSFDYNLDLSALKSLLKIFKVEDTKLPALVIDESLYTGFQSLEDIYEISPEIKKMQEDKDKLEKLEMEEQAKKELLDKQD